MSSTESSTPGLGKAAQGLRVLLLRLLLGLALGLGAAGCGGGGSASNKLAPPGGQFSAVGQNVVPITLDHGPSGVNGIFNVPYVSITLCRPGTSICQTIDHILLDTGSYGLRIIEARLLDPTLALPLSSAPGGNPTGECGQFVSGYLWGAVRLADVKLGGDTALSLPIQVGGDTDPRFSAVPAACSGLGANLGSVGAFGANGVLGIGVFNQDCGLACVTQAVPATYYACSALACTASTMPLASQVANPVAALGANNNGALVVLPAVPTGGVSSLGGSLITGIDTQSNNQLGAATVYATDASGHFSTTYRGNTLTASFIDSGSNVLYFTDSSITRCPISTLFYCPPAPVTLSAVNTSTVNGASAAINFTIEAVPWDTNPTSNVIAVSLAAQLAYPGHTQSFDWGLPFFFGRTVAIGIDGRTTASHGSGPFWAW
jgi:hypothetical protein